MINLVRRADLQPELFACIKYFCNFGKRHIMTVSDLKLKIFRQIDSLEEPSGRVLWRFDKFHEWTERCE